ncbi:MAG: hypothetical protein ACHQ1D_00515 [Nitrososphaerales archaeon]
MSEIDNGAKTIPSWFLWLISGTSALFTVTFIPWSSYITYSVFAHETQLALVKTQEPRILALEKTTNEFMAQIQVLAATKFTADSARILTSAIETRLERMETKLDNTKEELSRIKSDLELVKKSTSPK